MISFQLISDKFTTNVVPWNEGTRVATLFSGWLSVNKLLSGIPTLIHLSSVPLLKHT